MRKSFSVDQCGMRTPVSIKITTNNNNNSDAVCLEMIWSYRDLFIAWYISNNGK